MQKVNADIYQHINIPKVKVCTSHRHWRYCLYHQFIYSRLHIYISKWEKAVIHIVIMNKFTFSPWRKYKIAKWFSVKVTELMDGSIRHRSVSVRQILIGFKSSSLLYRIKRNNTQITSKARWRAVQRRHIKKNYGHRREHVEYIC